MPGRTNSPAKRSTSVAVLQAPLIRSITSGVLTADSFHRVTLPVYSHVEYDIMPDEHQIVRQPDILILEGLNVLQVDSQASEFVSDYFDFSIYIDAQESDIEDWFVDRFFTLRKTVFQNPASFFTHFAQLSDTEADQVARSIWREINGKNLSENIAPTRSRASLVMHKGADHRITEVHLLKL